MRITSILLAGALALVANAQSSTTSTAPTTTDPATAAQNSAQAAILRCIEACRAGDVSCTSKCIAVPNPNESQVNATNTCVANCPQGNGTQAETEAYSRCVQDCIGRNYFTASAGTPQPTGGSSSGNGNNNGNGGGNNNGNGSGGGSTNPSGTGGNQASGTTTGAGKSTSTGAAEKMMQVSGAGLGLVGFMAAVLAL